MMSFSALPGPRAIATVARMTLMLISIAAIAHSTFIVTANQKLLNLLLNESYYDKDIRPMNANGDPLVVTIIPNQFLLLTMDQQQETIEYLCEFMLSWVDPQLSWLKDETEFDEDWIKVPEERIWVPDIIFDYSLSRTELMPKNQRVVDVRSDGTVRQSSPAVIVTTCHLDIQSFPYDEQECQILLGPWIYDATEVTVRSFTDIIYPSEKFEGNNEWEMIDIQARHTVSVEDERVYSAVEYDLQLKRKPVYYVLVIQAPAFIIGTLTIFGIFTPFSVHGERKERVTLGLTMLLSISMMFNLVSEMMPKASRLPLLGNYILIEIFMCAVAVLISIILLYLHHRVHTRVVRVPKWITKLLSISSCECVRKPRALDELLPPVKISAGQPLILETDTSSALTQLMRLRVTIAKTVASLSESMARLETTEIIRSTWSRVFDSLDLLFLLAFQLFNVLISIAYMKSPELYVNIINQTLTSAEQLPQSTVANTTTVLIASDTVDLISQLP